MARIHVVVIHHEYGLQTTAQEKSCRERRNAPALTVVFGIKIKEKERIWHGTLKRKTDAHG